MTTTAQMTKTPTQIKTTLEVATFDFRSARIQFGIGFAVTLITFALVVHEFFATRFLTQEYLTVGKMLAEGVLNTSFLDSLKSDPLLTIQFLVFSHHAWWYRIISFLANGMSAMAVGLITLEITIRYGNRIGAAAAIFAALLFLAVPYNNALTLPTTMLPILLSNFFALSAVFLDLRFRLLRETEYYWLTLLCLVLSGVLNVSGVVMATAGIGFARLFIKENERRSAGGVLHSYVGMTTYLFAAFFFIIPHVAMTHGVPTSPDSLFEFVGALLGTSADGKVTQRVLPVLLVTICGISIIRLALGSLWLRPVMYVKLWLAASVTAWWVLGLGVNPANAALTTGIFLTPPLCILLALCALPGIDAMTKKSRIIFTAIGSLITSGVIVFWGAMVAGDVNEQYTSARELGLFKVALAKRMEKTEGKLVVVNPPFSASSAVEASVDVQPEFLLAGEKESEDFILRSLLNSPLTGQNIPVVSLKRLPIAFPRIAKKENEIPNPDLPASKVTDFYVWSNETGQLVPVYYSGAGSLNLTVTPQNFKTDPPDIARIKSGDWAQINKDQPFIEIGDEGMRLNPGSKTDVTVWLTHESLDPTKASKIIVTCAPQELKQGAISLVFKGKDSDEVGVIQLRVAPGKSQSSTLEANTKGIADWNKHSGIAALGIKLKAGTPGIVVKTVQTGK